MEIRNELTGIAKEMILNKYYLTSRTQYLNILLFTIFLNNFVFQKDIEALKFLIDECIPLDLKKPSVAPMKILLFRIYISLIKIIPLH